MNEEARFLQKNAARPDEAPPAFFELPKCGAGAQLLQGRCIFSNDCVCIRVFGLPKGCDVGRCFAGCAGSLTVAHGALEIRTQAHLALLGEGESIRLPLREATELRTEKGADVVLFERMN